MIEYLPIAEVATQMGLPMEVLIQRLTDLGLSASGARPSMCALLAGVAKKFPYSDGEGNHSYGWSLKRVSVLISEET